MALGHEANNLSPHSPLYQCDTGHQFPPLKYRGGATPISPSERTSVIPTGYTWKDAIPPLMPSVYNRLRHDEEGKFATSQHVGILGSSFHNHVECSAHVLFDQRRVLCTHDDILQNGE